MLPIHVLFCIDNNYLVQAATSISSILKSNQENTFVIYVAAFARDRIVCDAVFGAVEKANNLILRFVDLDDNLFEGYPTTKYFSKSIYSRLIFDRFLDASINRLIYLDADTITCGDLLPLWKTDLEGAVLGVARDFFHASPGEIGFADNEPYFNSGMLLIDTQLWRNQDCGAKVLRLIAECGDKLTWMDQDALNIVMRGTVKLIDLKWNYQPRCADVPSAFLQLNEADYRTMRKYPTIIHYTTSFKPWNAAFRVHYSEQYFAAQCASGIPLALQKLTPHAANLSDRILAAKTWLRWRFPRSFTWFRSTLLPTAAAQMYRASSDV